MPDPFATPAFSAATAIVSTPRAVHQHIMNMQQVISLLERAGYTNITRITLGHRFYDVNGVNIHGQKIQLKVDSVSGAITGVHHRH
ncbi:MAG: PepSY domain-containing protein [Legionellales bacterium]|nr:PepSY domain-containing protein [Legionellales bacterium]